MSVDLSSAGISKTAALSVVRAIAEKWDVQKTARYQLLGVPESTANHWFSALDRGDIDQKEVLKAAVLERISHIASIYDLSHRLVKGNEADAWMQRGNSAFGGQAPIALVMNGRAEDLIRVRWYLERVASR